MHVVASFFLSLFLTINSWLGMSHEAPILPPHSTASTTSPTQSPIATSAPHTVAENTPATPHKTPPTTSTTTTTNLSSNGSAWLTTLPLGDGKYVIAGPKKGFVYVCHVQSGGGGAQVVGPWIHRDTWVPSEKVHVQGSVAWPQATYQMNISGGVRTISSNDLPTDHTTGIFPISMSDPAAAYDQNPSSILAQNYSFSLPAYPTAASSPGCIYGEVGIMDNGVLLFDGFDALYRDALAHELQDSNDGHPNQEGYHKHGFISEIKNLPATEVVGFAFDGYPITGPMLASGNYLTTADLDECHGIESAIKLDGKLQTTYHYVLTQDFPYSVGCFHGTSKVTPQTLKGQTGGSPSRELPPQQQGANPPAPPQEAIDACNGKSSSDSCSVGPGMTGACATIGSYFACLPH